MTAIGKVERRPIRLSIAGGEGAGMTAVTNRHLPREAARVFHGGRALCVAAAGFANARRHHLLAWERRGWNLAEQGPDAHIGPRAQSPSSTRRRIAPWPQG